MGHEVPVAVSYYSPPLWIIKKENRPKNVESYSKFYERAARKIPERFRMEIIAKENRQERDVKFDDVVSKVWN